MFLPTQSPGFLSRKFSFSIMVDAATWIPISVSVGKSGAQDLRLVALNLESACGIRYAASSHCCTYCNFSFNLSRFSQNPKV